MTRFERWAIAISIALFAFVLPVLILHVTAPQPQTRRIHIELFRYGSDPEIIHVNRGDTLVLTFSSRDTAHSFLLQEYDLDVKVSPHSPTFAVARPSQPEAEPVMMDELVIQAGQPGIMGLFGSKSRFRCHVYCGEMHAFEQGFFIVNPNYLHAGSTGVLLAIPMIGLLRLRWRRAGDPHSASTRVLMVNLFERWPLLKRILSAPGLQYWLMTACAVLMYLVILISLLGTKMAGGNLGVLLVWVVWLALLVVVMVPLGGRAWCTVCPVPILGDAIQRGSAIEVRHGSSAGGRYNNLFRGLMLEWPKRLSTALPRTLAFVCFATVAVLIISQPRWTGWVLVILLVAATLLPLIFELRTFCRWLCPINSFISLYSSTGRLTLRSSNPTLCGKCRERDLETCLKGNAKGWACPYGISVAGLDRNNDCGLCLECIKSCSCQNVAVNWRPFGLERALAGIDEALQAVVMLTLGIVYCVIFQGPWHRLRDMVDIVDKGNWDQFVVYAITLWLVALVLAPVVVYLLSWIGVALSGADVSRRDAFVRDASALVPMGLFVWIAFAIPMVLVEGSFVLSTLSDPFGWGWDLFGTAGQPWWQVFPGAIPAIQTALVLIGLALALRTLLRFWSESAAETGRAVRGMLPAAAMLVALTFGLVWFYTA